MNSRCLGSPGVLAVAMAWASLASAQTLTPPRTPDGHPDLQGVWTNATITPIERPKELGAKEFYTEVPFEVEFDGPYYSMLGFFDRLGKVERIVNVANLLVASTRKPTDAKAKHTYQYAPSESVVATCLTTTYFSHDLDPAAPASKPGPPVKK